MPTPPAWTPPTINKRGIEPIKAELDRIRAMENMPDVVAELVRLHRVGIGVLFNFGARPDAKDSNRTIAGLSQGGLSLPDREYYLKTDAKSVEIRQRFVAHMTKMFQLAGDSAESAAQATRRLVLDMETILAKASMDRVSLRDPNKTYHIMTKQQAGRAGAQLRLGRSIFTATGAPAFETLNVSQPDYIKQMSAETWRTRRSIPGAPTSPTTCCGRAPPTLPEAFENEAFDFWSRYLSGAKEQRPRTARCVATVDRQLGDLLGQKYIELTFGADAKAQITQLVDALEKAMAEDIRTLALDDRGDEEGRARQAEGHHQQCGRAQEVARLRQAHDRARRFLRQRRAQPRRWPTTQRIEKIGKPTDKTEWGMTTPTVNAFYSPQNNSINFPAGILQTPFFDPRRDMALNYGGAGAVIGHEMTHGFDDQGRKFDGDGNLRDWWTAGRRRRVRQARRLHRQRVFRLHRGGRREAQRPPDAGREHRR